MHQDLPSPGVGENFRLRRRPNKSRGKYVFPGEMEVLV
jgi:hypothetical protein